MANQNQAQPSMTHGDLETEAAFACGLMAQTADERLAVLKGAELEGIPLTVHDGKLEVMRDALAEADKRRPAPPRRRGSYVLHELDSFVDFVNRFKEEGRTVAFADVSRLGVVAVFNGHPEGATPEAAGWEDHRASYTCPRAPEWALWTEAAKKAYGQEAFAQLIESRMEDLVGPDKEHPDAPAPAALLEMARNLQINTQGKYRRTFDPATGTGTLIAETDHGPNSTPIPREFHLRLRVFEGGEFWRVRAKLRFVLEQGAARFSFELHREVEIVREAFDAVRKHVHEHCGIPVFAGNAP